MKLRWWMWLSGSLVLLSSSASVVAVSPRQSPQASPATSSRAVINQYCVGCHNERTKTANLALDALDVDRVTEHTETWEKVVRKLRARMMPPLGRPRPDEATFDAVVQHLETSLDRAAASNPNPGRTDTFRRLNRTEYQNAIRDLLAVQIDVSELLPGDDASHGFDNVSVGELSPALLERYLTAAQKISRLAVGTPPAGPAASVTVLPVDFTQEEHIDGLPFGTRGGALVNHIFPVEGVYELQVRLMRNRNENVEGLSERHELELTIDGERIQVFTVEPKRSTPPGGVYYADEEADTHLKTRVAVKAGPHAVAATFIRKTGALLETERQPYIARFNQDRHPRTQPAVYSVSIGGPFDAAAAGDTPSRQKIFICKPVRTADEDGCAQKIISSLARRAYRRPVTNDDTRALIAFYREGRRGSNFENGVEMALRAMLTSPEFLFRIERDPENVRAKTPYRISDVELASRLAFFLWSSIPDDELLDLAARGRLRDPAELEKQVRRMLADPRSESLVSNFADQWLYLRNLPATNPDARLFPDYDDNLRQAFRRETQLFFESIAKENRSMIDLLDADYTFLNERLAKHYGVPNVYGSHFRRISLPAETQRGGLLGHGSILTVTSYANRTSPVLRGKWILENILGAPPPEPPANVPPLKDNDPAGKALTMRERMAQHRESPACSGCHQLMDPIGLSMENFDAVGRWRNRAEGDAAIDAAGALPSGATFQGVSGLKRALLAEPDLFAATVTEKLLVYSLGRGVEFYDAPAVRAITNEARSNDYRFSSFILGVIKSSPFQFRRSQ
jgi:hypothetical protein